MITRHSMRQIPVLILFLLTTSVRGTATTITDLGYFVLPYAINNSGQVVGQANQGAFLYTPSGGGSGLITELSAEEAPAINSSGEIVTNTANHHIAVVPGPVDLGPGGAQGINDAGQIVGSTLDHQAALFTIAGPTLLGAGVNSVAWDINNSGQITGEAPFGGGTDHAFLYSDGILTDLGALSPDPTHQSSLGFAINDAGQVTGYSDTVDAAGIGRTHAFLYTNGHMIDIGVLGNGIVSWGYAINNAGDVVGYSAEWGGANTRAFVYSNGVLIDLNSLLASDSGWVLQYATGINDRGQIIGIGSFNGQYSGFLLDTDFSTGGTATPEPASWILFACGIIAVLAVRRSGRALCLMRWISTAASQAQ